MAFRGDQRSLLKIVCDGGFKGNSRTSNRGTKNMLPHRDWETSSSIEDTKCPHTSIKKHHEVCKDVNMEDITGQSPTSYVVTGVGNT